MVNQTVLEISANYHNKSGMSERAVLTTRNIQLAILGDKIESMIYGGNRVFLSADKVEYAKKD